MFNLLEMIFIRLFKASVNATIIGALIIILKGIFKKKLSTSKSNLLWLLFIILLLFPIEFESKLSLENYVSKYDNLNYTFENLNYSFMEEKVETKSNYSIFQILLISWFLITVIEFIMKNIFYIRFKNEYINADEANETLLDILESLKKELGIKRNIKLVMQDKTKTPAIIGVINPTILLPKDIETLSLGEIKYVFMHELTHYKKGDTFLYLILNELNIIYWFNPFIYFEIKRMKQDLEVATDEETLKEIGFTNIKEYCKTILKMACWENKKILLEVPNISSSGKDLERRIKMLKLNNNIGKEAIVLLIVLAIVISIATISLASTEVKVENIKKVDFDYNYELNVEESNRNKELVLINPIESDELMISTTFGERVHPFSDEKIYHNGIDIVAENGDKVLAIADGLVLETGFDIKKGNYVIINHNDLTSEYNHLSKILVNQNEYVSQGDIIGKVGQTGYATGPHLHFSLKNAEGEYIDPLGEI